MPLLTNILPKYVSNILPTTAPTNPFTAIGRRHNGCEEVLTLILTLAPYYYPHQPPLQRLEDDIMGVKESYFALIKLCYETETWHRLLKGHIKSLVDFNNRRSRSQGEWWGVGSGWRVGSGEEWREGRGVHCNTMQDKTSLTHPLMSNAPSHTRNTPSQPNTQHILSPPSYPPFQTTLNTHSLY